MTLVMPGFDRSPGPEAAQSAPRPVPFRLVDDVVEASQPVGDEARPDGEDAGLQARLLALVPAKLLIAGEDWSEGNLSRATDTVSARAEVPLLASLARIRSEADAALALTGVLELVARRFHVGLPCGVSGDDGFTFTAPAGVDLARIAEAIDDSLLGLVRATDLRGALRDRCQARVEKLD